MPRWLNIKIIILFAVVGFSYYGYTRLFAPGPQQAAGASQHALPVSVATVIERDIQLWNEFSGRLVATEQVAIRPRVSGTIEQIHFKSGAMVKKGELLFTLDAKPYAAELARSQGLVASASAQLKLSHSELKRADQLIDKKVLSQSDYDNRKNAALVNEANLKSAHAALEIAHINLAYTKIHAPIAGTISRAEITIGNLIEAGMNTPVLATVVANAPIYADFEVDERTFLHYAHQKTPGYPAQPIKVMMGLATESETPHLGYIDSFDNQLNSTSGTIRVRAIFQNPQRQLLPGLFAKIKFADNTKTKSILITDRAVSTDQNKKFVYVLDKNQQPTYREVKLGPTVEGLRLVQSGLQAGEKIVVNGLQRVRPGQPIMPELVIMDAPESPQAGTKEPV